MTNPHRLIYFVRPRRLIAAGLFAFLAYVFANNLDPTPRFEVKTEAKTFQGLYLRCRPYSATVEHLSDDGTQVIVEAHNSEYRGYYTELQLWDMCSATDRTPAHWRVTDWRRLLGVERHGWYRVEGGLVQLLTNKTGREFLFDAEAWSALRDRLTSVGAKNVKDVHQNIRPVRVEERRGDPFPSNIRFSPDGRMVSFVIHNRWPVHIVCDCLEEATAFEDSRTGRPIEWPLTGMMSPDRQTLLDYRIPDEDGGEQPWLWLWDLATMTVRTPLWTPDAPSEYGYSPDRSYVYATCRKHPFFSRIDGTEPVDYLRWWDAETGTLLGDMESYPHVNFIDGGKTLLLYDQNATGLQYLDAATGGDLGIWIPKDPPGGKVGQLVSERGNRYFIAQFDRDTTAGKPSSPLTDKFAGWLARRLPDSDSRRDRSRKIVLDVIDRRVVGDVPGVSAVVSENDRYLASIDADGVVRVWELPLRRPWPRGFAYSAILVFGSWLVLAMLGKLRRRIWSPHVD
jgi:hypothetical protein